MNSAHAFSPFGSAATTVHTLPVAALVKRYRDRFGYEAARHFEGVSEIKLLRCERTGLCFWTPREIAGDEPFYAELSSRLATYYRTTRWEYGPALEAIGNKPRQVLEVGCGRGYFLRMAEQAGHGGMGIEFNRQAIASRVTSLAVEAIPISEFAASCDSSFDVVCTYQVLEHVTQPREFLQGCVQALRPGGLLIVSVPNFEFKLHKSFGDPLDLPPHHVNHFTPRAMRGVAEAIGVKVIDLKVQPEREPRFNIWLGPEHKGAERLIRSAAKGIASLLGEHDVPGHTLLTVMQKPTA